MPVLLNKMVFACLLSFKENPGERVRNELTSSSKGYDAAETADCVCADVGLERPDTMGGSRPEAGAKGLAIRELAPASGRDRVFLSGGLARVHRARGNSRRKHAPGFSRQRVNVRPPPSNAAHRRANANPSPAPPTVVSRL